MKKNTQHSQHTGSFHERPLVTAVRHALPYVVGLSLALSMVPSASSRSSESAAAFTATQLVRQFTLKNTVAQVSMGMQGYVAEVAGQQRGPAMGARPAGFSADMGSVPNTVNLPRRDGAGRPLGYCAWDNNSATITADYNAGQGVANPLVYAVVSPGLNGVMQTTCADVLASGAGLGDDHVQVTAPIQVSSKQYKTSVSTSSDLATTPGEEGDIRLVRDTNKLYSYVGGAWAAVGPFIDDAAGGVGAVRYTTGKVTVAAFQATTATLTGALTGAGATFAGGVAAATFTGNGASLTDLNGSNFSSGVISPQFGGTGVNGAAAANGTLLIGNGSGFTLGTLTAGAGISVLNSAGAITISNTGVISIAGTADQVITSASNGNVVLSLPQAIATTSTPTFAGMMLNGNLVGTTATFTGAVTVGSLAAQRIDVSTSAGGVTFSNLIVGVEAMSGAQSGLGGNTALGIRALRFNTSGPENTAVGRAALEFNNTGAYNTAVGRKSLSLTTSGSDNTALGSFTGESNTTGSRNTFVGSGADVTAGALNYATAIGASSRVSTSNTLALGRNSALDQVVMGTDTRNDTFANTKLYVNGVTNLNGDLRGTTATFSGAVNMGSLAVQRIDVSTNTGVINPNMIVGTGAMAGAQSGTGGNSAVGILALSANTTGQLNTATGLEALRFNTSGNFNTATGFQALYSNSTGYSNSAFGINSLLNNTTGYSNAALGGSSGGNNTTGTFNTFLGASADASTGGLSYATAIGSNSVVSTSNTIAIGRTTDFTIIGATGTATSGILQNKRLQVTGDVGISGNLAIGGDFAANTFSGTSATFTGAVTAQRLNLNDPTGVTFGNLIIGPNALAGAQSGQGANIAIGTNALNANTTGSGNVAIGFNSQVMNSTGNGNQSIGPNTLSSNTTGYNNAVIGVDGMRNNTSGFENTASGAFTLSSNTTGNYNTAVGAFALSDNTTGGSNTAVGQDALRLNTTGPENTALGRYALRQNTTGGDNVATGAYALRNNISGYSNVAIGRQALENNTTGQNNVALGRESGITNITGSNNTFLGHQANASTAALAFATAIGSNALVSTSNTIAIGRTTDFTVIGATGTAASGVLQNKRLQVTGDVGISGNLAIGGDFAANTISGTSATFTGAVTALRLNVNDPTGVTFGNLVLGTNNLAVAQSGAGANVAIGNNALNANTTGAYNVAIGYDAQQFNTTGYDNTGVGIQTLRNNTTGFSNAAMGAYVLSANTTGQQNAALGAYALNQNTTGFNNVALGQDSGNSNTTGSNNTFLGFDADATSNALTYAGAIGAGSRVATSNTLALGRNSALDQIVIGTDTRNDTFANTKLYVNGVTNLNGDLRGTTATFSGAVNMGSLTAQRIDVSTSAGGVFYPNMIVGTGAMAGAQSGSGGNTAVGIDALRNNTTGSANTASGLASLFSNTIGNNNTAFGDGAMYLNTSGSGNTATGREALRNNTTGSANTASGQASLFSNTTGNNNTAFGDGAMYLSTTGGDNTAVGREALRDNSTGFNNTALGRNAGRANTTGSNNTFLGNDSNSTTGALSYVTAIGSGSRVATSNTIALGRNSALDQIIIGTDTRNDTFAGTKLYVNGVTNLNGDLRGTTATFSGAVTMGSLAAQRIDVSTSAGGVTNPNMIVGTGAMPLAQSGFGANTALGFGALAANTTGYLNTASGYQALTRNTIGFGNTATGRSSLVYNTTGSNNTASGDASLFYNTTGYNNTASGNRALYFNTTGYNNVALGRDAGDTNTTGSNNIFIGDQSDATSAALTYAAAIGSYSTVATSNTIALGRNSAVDQIVIGTDTRNDTYAGTKLYVNGNAAVNGDVVLATSGTGTTLGSKISFGAVNEGTDPIFMGRINASADNSILQITLGDNNFSAFGDAGDRFQIATGNGTVQHYFDSNGNAYHSGNFSIAGNVTSNLNVTSGNYVRFGHANQLNGDDGKIGANLFSEGLNIVGTQTVASAGRKITMYGSITALNDLNVNGNLSGTTATFTGAVTMNSLAAQRLDVGTSAGGVSERNMIVGASAMPGAQTGGGANTAVGISALASNSSGTNNVAVGYNALVFNTSGSNNSAFGKSSLLNNTTGFGNTAFGVFTLGNNTTSAFNSAFGSQALQNSTGGSNTALGQIAGFDTTTGSGNTFVGSAAGRTNTTGSNNSALGAGAQPSSGALTYATVIGSEARVATSNTIALGRNSALDQIVIGTDTRNDTFAGTKLYVNGVTNLNGDLRGTTATFSGAVTMNSLAAQRIDVATSAGGVGSANMIVGTGAMTGAQSGNGGNTALGINSLSANTTGWRNVAVGLSALRANTSGDRNIAVGSLAMFSNTGGSYNIAMGDETLFSNTSGFSNTGIGIKSLLSNTTGNGNVGLGDSSGSNNISGNNNTFIGYQANPVSGALSYAAAFGADSSVSTSNTIAIGRTTDVTVMGATGADATGNRLQVTGNVGVSGNVVLNTSGAGTTTGSKIMFGAPGEGTDAMYLGRINTSADNSVLQLQIGDNSDAVGANGDRFQIVTGSSPTSVDGPYTVRHYFDSNGSAYHAGTVTMGSLTAQRIDVSTSTGVISPNMIVGTGALALAQTGGGGNTALGVAALNANTSGEKNVAVGLGSMYLNSTGSLNIAIGDAALYSNTIGGSNTAVGQAALFNNTSGYSNTSIGQASMINNTTGYSNVAVGQGVMTSNSTGFENTALGANSLITNSTGSRNVALGLNTLLRNTTGYQNVALGVNSLFETTSGYFNTALGTDTLYFNTTGYSNTAFGRSAGNTNSTGSNNTFLGAAADANSAALTYATAMGAGARVSTSNTVVLGRSDGSDQVVIGANFRNDDYTNTKLFVNGAVHASSVLATQGTAISTQGAYLQWNRTSGSGATYLVNQKGLGGGGISFGESTLANAYSENMYLSSGGNLSVVGSMTATAFNVSSDRRLKTNINQLDTGNVLDKLEALRTYSYDYISNRDLGRRIGVIAQELQPLFPEAVAVRADGFMAVDYNALGAMAAVGVGQLSSKFKILDNRVTEQGTLITALDEKVDKVDGRVSSLETWKTEAVGRMDGFQTAIDSNVKKIAENALAIQGNTTEIKRLDEVLVALDGTVKGNSESIKNINTRWGNTFNMSADGSLLTVIATELKVSNFTAQQMRSNSVYTQRLEAEMASIRELEVDSLKANTAVANSVQAKMVNTGAAQVYAGVGAPAFLFSAPSDGHYTVNTSAMDGSYATATVIVNAGQAKVVPIASEGIELMAIGNTVKANAAGKSIKASWIKTG